MGIFNTAYLPEHNRSPSHVKLPKSYETQSLTRNRLFETPNPYNGMETHNLQSLGGKT